MPSGRRSSSYARARRTTVWSSVIVLALVVSTVAVARPPWLSASSPTA